MRPRPRASSRRRASADASTPREPARTPARPAATPDSRRLPALDAEERKEFEISDDALDIPDFLKER